VCSVCFVQLKGQAEDISADCSTDAAVVSDSAALPIGQLEVPKARTRGSVMPGMRTVCAPYAHCLFQQYDNTE